MKRLRIELIGGARSLTRLTPRPRPQCPFRPQQQQHMVVPQCRQIPGYRLQSTTSKNPATLDESTQDPETALDVETEDVYDAENETVPDFENEDAFQALQGLEALPSPPISAASNSAKLAALHARLALPKRLPLETLARALVDSSADPNPDFNNSALATIGNDLIGYYTSEHIICHYPRLPMSVLFAAQSAYGGDKALAAVAREWGVDTAAAPGGEVDPGLLQYKTVDPGTEFLPYKRGTGRPNEERTQGWNRSMSSRIVYDDQFGETRGRQMVADPQLKVRGVTQEAAKAKFVRAVVGAVYVHSGRTAAQRFTAAHFLSRHLDFASLFDFRTPTRDLSKLCAREGFEPPIARLISETGRASRHPVFVVGVYSGRDKLGEGAGASLDEGRVRAAAAALKSWYLYSPLEITKPSETEGAKEVKKWVPNMVDIGEIIV